jgi:hypothetical protein
VFLVCWRGKGENGRAVSKSMHLGQVFFNCTIQFLYCGLDLRHDLVPRVQSHVLVCRSSLTCACVTYAFSRSSSFSFERPTCAFFCAHVSDFLLTFSFQKFPFPFPVCLLPFFTFASPKYYVLVERPRNLA